MTAITIPFFALQKYTFELRFGFWETTLLWYLVGFIISFILLMKDFGGVDSAVAFFGAFLWPIMMPTYIFGLIDEENSNAKRIREYSDEIEKLEKQIKNLKRKNKVKKVKP